MNEWFRTDLTKRPNRPLGVTILTLLLALSAGLLPLIFSVMLLFTPVGEIVGPLNLIFSTIVALGVLVSAFGTWRGIPRFRDLLVTFSTLHFVGVAFNNALLALEGVVPEDRTVITWGRVIRSAFSIGIVFWYFKLSDRANYFFDSYEGVSPEDDIDDLDAEPEGAGYR